MGHEPMSYPARIRELARTAPTRAAYRQILRYGRETALTWGALDRRSDQLAGALAGRGVNHGDRVGIGLRNSPELILTVFAAWKLGATPVPIRWDLPTWELGRLREVVDATLHVDDTDLGWIAATADAPVPDLADAVAPALNGICSSGSTGLPKVIVSGTPALWNEVFATPMADAWGTPVPRPQVILVLAPMYHANGFATIYTMLGGDSLVVLEAFDAALVLDVIERHRITTFTATPTMLKRIADVPGVDGRDLSSIRWILQGAAAMPPSLVERWAGLIGAEKLFMAYGMSEAIGITALRGDEWMTHRGSVGRPQRGTEIRILDHDGREVPTGQIGDIHLRAPAYGGSTYLGADALPATADGFRTVGDMGHVDADGYLHLADRRVDLIISGGANVFPAEVETALIDHPEVADVVVIGLRDPEWGHRVHALIEPRNPHSPPGPDEIIRFAKGRLAPYKVPKTIELVAEIPRSAATKVNRGALVRAREG